MSTDYLLTSIVLWMGENEIGVEERVWYPQSGLI